MVKRCRANPEDVSVIETSQMKRKQRLSKFEHDRREQELLDSLAPKKMVAVEKLSARDYLPHIPHPEGPAAPLLSGVGHVVAPFPPSREPSRGNPLSTSLV
jgi:hypothetical protein